MKHKLFFVSVASLHVFCLVTMSMAKSQEMAIKAIDRFSFDLYQKCADQSVDENIILSPFSVANALALLSQGAQGNTFDQIAHGLHLEANKTAIADAFAASNNVLNKNTGQAILSIANQIYVHQDYQIQQTFHDVAVNKFKSGVENVDFANSAAAAKTINAFVEQKTNDKIKNLFDPDSFEEDTRLVLVNAIYFKGVWEQKFLPEQTKSGNFYLDAVNAETVDFMQNTGTYNYGEIYSLNAKTIELRYANSNISFVAVLPFARTGLSALEAFFAKNRISTYLKYMYAKEVDVKLPKFKIEYEIKLNQVLKELGMSEMFEKTADFGGLLESSVKLQVSEAIHKAFIEVNEEGSEAAAVTVFRSVPMSAFYEAPRPEEFYADHPFMYFILDRNTDTVLFAGRYKKSN